MPEIHLFCLGSETADLPAWSLGQVVSISPTPQAIAHWLAKHNPANRSDEWWLFWDVALGNPDHTIVATLCQTTSDVFHAGLRLGLCGWPRLHNFVNPTWTLNCDPDPLLEATSWRLSLRACLVRGTVLAQLGGPDACFSTLSGASLELGHRWITQGAFMRHCPDLVVKTDPLLETPPALSDEFGFVYRRYGRMWTVWAFYRVLVHNYRWMEVWSALRQVWRWPVTKAPTSLSRPSLIIKNRIPKPSVSVLIPTLDRYPYLFQLLDQLRYQTVPPLEIIVVDQTEISNRQPEWPQPFADLPLRVIWRDKAGQCSSRNAGLETARGDYVLFLDDDDEIANDLIATHLAFLQMYPADASCGVAEEVAAGPLPQNFTFSRSSDVFPTNNTLLSREALFFSGLFDLAYETGSRADGDLGMRLYLAGKQLLLNPLAQVLHLHAPKGGLRQHKARVITRASSRSNLWQRHLLAPTEGYLWGRYFTTEQRGEAIWIRTFATLRYTGKGWQKLVRFLLMGLILPFTYYQNRQRLQKGLQLKKIHPTIPSLSERDKG